MLELLRFGPSCVDPLSLSSPLATLASASSATSLPAPCTRNRVKCQKQARHIACSWRFIGSLRSGHMLVRLCESVVPPAQGCSLDRAPTLPRATHTSSGVSSNPCYRGKFIYYHFKPTTGGRPHARTLIHRLSPPASSPPVNGQAERGVLKLDTVSSRPLAARRPPSVCLDQPCSTPHSCVRRRRACSLLSCPRSPGLLRVRGTGSRDVPVIIRVHILV